jgi:hypothetical protein
VAGADASKIANTIMVAKIVTCRMAIPFALRLQYPQICEHIIHINEIHAFIYVATKFYEHGRIRPDAGVLGGGGREPNPPVDAKPSLNYAADP